MRVGDISRFGRKIVWFGRFGRKIAGFGRKLFPLLAIRCNIALLWAMPQAISPSAPSMYQGNLQQISYVLGMSECSIGTYYAIVQYHLVLLCTGTYYLVRRFTILAVSAFRFGTTYVESWTAISAVQLSTYKVPNQKAETARIVNRCTR